MAMAPHPNLKAAPARPTFLPPPATTLTAPAAPTSPPSRPRKRPPRATSHMPASPRQTPNAAAWAFSGGNVAPMGSRQLVFLFDPVVATAHDGPWGQSVCASSATATVVVVRVTFSRPGPAPAAGPRSRPATTIPRPVTTRAASEPDAEHGERMDGCERKDEQECGDEEWAEVCVLEQVQGQGRGGDAAEPFSEYEDGEDAAAESGQVGF
uniref:Uncharacterized protein n=1 Tax=Mycena chlorophos TaxID=658473 RepID=A0ABQ0LSC2_MYCCL|nr:predicted protein [Mycena chlorophos]